MKIAITSEGGGMEGNVAGHFGRCREFVFVEVGGGKVKSAKVVPNPYFGDHVPGAVPEFIRKSGAGTIISCGMGPMAVRMFNQFGIEVVFCGSGKVAGVLSEYLSGKLKPDKNLCDH